MQTLSFTDGHYIYDFIPKGKAQFRNKGSYVKAEQGYLVKREFGEGQIEIDNETA